MGPCGVSGVFKVLLRMSPSGLGHKALHRSVARTTCDLHKHPYTQMQWRPYVRDLVASLTGARTHLRLDETNLQCQMRPSERTSGERTV